MPEIVSRCEHQGVKFNIAEKEQRSDEEEWLDDYGFYAVVAFSLIDQTRLPDDGYADSPESLKTLAIDLIDERLEEGEVTLI